MKLYLCGHISLCSPDEIQLPATDTSHEINVQSQHPGGTRRQGAIVRFARRLPNNIVMDVILDRARAPQLKCSCIKSAQKPTNARLMFRPRVSNAASAVDLRRSRGCNPLAGIGRLRPYLERLKVVVAAHLGGARCCYRGLVIGSSHDGHLRV